MANLLQKASIVLTPTAYNDGEVLCAKPDDGSGDFDFSRNSAATRVNAQGLVENVQILSSNLVQNGDFSEEGAEEVSNGSFSQEGVELITNGNFDTDSGWGLGTNWNISNGKANAVSSPNGVRLEQFNLGQSINRPYKVTFSVSNLTQGSFKVWFGSVQSQTITSDGDYIIYLTPTTTAQIFIYTIGTTTGSIDNVSVREVGQDWTLGTGTTISGGNANFLNADSVSLYQSIGNQSGFVKITFNVTDYTSGTLNVYSGGNQSVSTINVSANALGTYTAYVDRNGGNVNIIFGSIDNFIGSITNISVKEVGMDWELGTGFSIGENKAVATNSSNSNLEQVGITITNTKKYKINFTISDYTTGAVRPMLGAVGAVPGTFVSANGTYTEVLTANNNFDRIVFRTGGTAFNGSITNISVIEITDDTNLPRINYEGFSYQDALGSELILNGSFDDGLNGWSTHSGSILELENGMAKVTTSSNSGWIKRTDLSIETGKTYFCKADITNAINKSWYINGTGNLVPLTLISGNTYGGYVTVTGNNPIFYIKGNQTNGEVSYIDNVSVKEYLGQEVVPNSGCGSWLFESQSTNLITQSELFSDASWIKAGASVTSNAVISPEGILNADKLVEDSTNGHHILDTGLMGSKSGSYTYSLFAKKGENNFLVLWWVYASPSKTWFDLENGVVGSQTGTATDNAKIEDYGNGWFKCSVTRNEIGNVYCVIGNSNQDAVFSYQGDGTSGIYIWGAQLEQQSYATSYIPTSGSTVTRNQDVCTNGGSLATINSTEGVLYAEIFIEENIESNINISLSAGVHQRNLVKLIYLPSTNELKAEAYNLVGVSTVITYLNLTLGQYNKISISYNSTILKLYVNGTQVGSTSMNGLPSGLDRLSFDRADNVANFYGKTKALAVWKEALSDQELTELTTI